MDFTMSSNNTFTSSTSPPLFNLSQPLFNLSVPTMPNVHIIDENNFSQKFKHPTLTDQVRLNSDCAIKSYNGIYHNFIVPAVGDYSQNFQLQSDYILKGFKDSMVHIDCLNNYIESVSLSINNGTNVIARVDGFSQIEFVHPQYLYSNTQSISKLDFVNLPLLTKCLDDSNYQIAIKFNQVPPIKYELIYDAMFTGDKNYHNILKKEDFVVAYQAKQSQSQRKKVGINYKNGKISAK